MNCFFTFQRPLTGLFQLDFDMTRSGFAGIAVNKPDELRVRFARAIAIHDERRFLLQGERKYGSRSRRSFVGPLLVLCQIPDVAKKGSVSSLLEGRVAFFAEVAWGLTAPA